MIGKSGGSVLSTLNCRLDALPPMMIISAVAPCRCVQAGNPLSSSNLKSFLDIFGRERNLIVFTCMV